MDKKFYPGKLVWRDYLSITTNERLYPTPNSEGNYLPCRNLSSTLLAKGSLSRISPYPRRFQTCNWNKTKTMIIQVKPSSILSDNSGSPWPKLIYIYMKMHGFWIKFDWSLFLGVQLALVQIMAWCRSGDKPLSEPMLVTLLTHICVTRPQWVYDNGATNNVSSNICWFKTYLLLWITNTWYQAKHNIMGQ